MTGWLLDQVFDFNGHPVRHAVRGDGPPLVFVHGTPFSSYVWHRIAPHFFASHRVHYFDLLGYGRSAQPEADVSLGVQNQLLAQLLDHWNLQRPDVVAHDFGGATALRTHLLNGKDYRSLTLIDPVALTPWGSPFVQHVRQHEAAFYRQIAQMDERYTREAEGLYPTIRCPVQILWGEDDQWIPVERGRALQQMIPGSRFHPIPDAGHLVQEDAPEAIVAALLRFL